MTADTAVFILGADGATLGDLLRFVPRDGRGDSWLVFDLWFLGSPVGAQAISVLLDEANLSTDDGGVRVATRELDALARDALQVVNGSFVALRDPARPADIPEDLREIATAVIQAVDSSYWRYWSEDQDSVERVRRAHPSARLERIEALQRVS